MWIKRRDYEELKKVSSKYSDVMKAIHSAETGAVTFCDFGVFMPNSAYNSYSHLVDRLKKEVSDLKEKHWIYKQFWNTISISVVNLWLMNDIRIFKAYTLMPCKKMRI